MDRAYSVQSNRTANVRCQESHPMVDHLPLDASWSSSSLAGFGLTFCLILAVVSLHGLFRGFALAIRCQSIRGMAMRTAVVLGTWTFLSAVSLWLIYLNAWIGDPVGIELREDSAVICYDGLRPNTHLPRYSCQGARFDLKSQGLAKSPRSMRANITIWLQDGKPIQLVSGSRDPNTTARWRHAADSVAEWCGR